MLQFIYSKENVRENLKKDIVELSDYFKEFDKFEEQEEILIQHYVPKITSIASNIAGLVNQNQLKDAYVLHRLFRASDKYDDLDVRYLSNFTSLEKKPKSEQGYKFVNAKINQTLIDLENELDLEDNPETRFILLNAIKYTVGKDVDEFELRKEECSNKLEDLIKALDKDADVYEVDYAGDMKNPVLTEKGVKARFKRSDLEEYVLKKLTEKAAEDIQGEIKGNIDEIYNLLNQKINLPDLNISDSSVENWEKTVSNDLFHSCLFNKFFKISKRTKLDINLNGNKRDYMFYKTNFIARNVDVKEVGDGFMLDSQSKIKGDVKVRKAGNWFMQESQCNINGDVKVGKAGNDFMYNFKGKIKGKLKYGKFGINRVKSLLYNLKN